MDLSPGIRRIAMFVLAVAAVVAVALAIIHHRESHNLATAQGVAKQSVAEIVRQSGPPQAQPPRISPWDEPSKISPEDESAFASLAEADVSQLHECIILAQWMDLHKSEGWETSTDEAYFDCRTLVRTEALPSGRQITRMVYFYPPEAPTPAVFPSLAGQELVDHT